MFTGVNGIHSLRMAKVLTILVKRYRHSIFKQYVLTGISTNMQIQTRIYLDHV